MRTVTRGAVRGHTSRTERRNTGAHGRGPGLPAPAEVRQGATCRVSKELTHCPGGPAAGRGGRWRAGRKGKLGSSLGPLGPALALPAAVAEDTPPVCTPGPSRTRGPHTGCSGEALPALSATPRRPQAAPRCSRFEDTAAGRRDPRRAPQPPRSSGGPCGRCSQNGPLSTNTRSVSLRASCVLGTVWMSAQAVPAPPPAGDML